jgi:hypothetical protein
LTEPPTTISVFIGTSVDGFIARPNNDLDFLPPGGGEPHGYNEKQIKRAEVSNNTGTPQISGGRFSWQNWA